MSQFSLYFSLGIKHLLDLYRVEYILFLIAVSVVFLLKDWRRVLILILFFTIGYGMSFYTSALGLFSPDRRLIDFLIFLTIFFTAVSNILRKKDQFHIRGNIQRNFFLALIFGIVQGYAFAHYFKGVADVRHPSFETLLAFNLGLEAGIFIVITAFLMIAFLFISLLGINRRDWVLVISSAIVGVAITMMFESRYW
jgi:hypothetical protein